MGCNGTAFDEDKDASAANWMGKLNTRFGGAPGATASRTASVGERDGRFASRAVDGWSWNRIGVPLVGLLGGGLAILLALKFSRPVATEADSLRATGETVLTLCALAGAWLFRAQWAQSHRTRDLLLASAVLMLAVTNASYALPTALKLHSGSTIAGPVLWGELFAAALFATAVMNRYPAVTARARWLVTIAAALCIFAVVLAELGPSGMGGQLADRGSEAYGLHTALHHQFAMVLIGVAAVLSAFAAAAFAHRGRRDRDRVALLLAVGLLLLAAAQFSRLEAITSDPNEMASIEVLRLLACAVLLLAALRGELRGRATLVRAAALAERQRVARDLHDGLAQDLAFIAVHGEQIAEELGPQHPVVLAARRALDVSRSTIAELSDPAATSAHETLEAVAHELGERFAIEVTIGGQLETEPEADAKHDLIRIAREAIANAARHGGAKHVAVSLESRDGAIMLRVRDDGCGFDPPRRPDVSCGLGIRSMDERAADCGGQLTIRRSGDRGTELEVVLA